ncbi:MAG TPA: hypothetical protein VJ302_31780 [Blastocatellia bacterium]|nr:hypothetical protein [Blastocatellia bacterium]
MKQHKKYSTKTVIKAACGHEYETTIFHDDDEELRQQSTWFASLDCPECILKQHSPEIAKSKRV